MIAVRLCWCSPSRLWRQPPQRGSLCGAAVLVGSSVERVSLHEVGRQKPPSLREVARSVGGSERAPKEVEGIYMSLPYHHDLIPLAKGLRKNATRQENHLWYDFLCTYPVRFQRQKTIDHFIVDFYCHAAKLVIEVDGSQHATEQGLAYDAERSAILQQYGLKVIRFSNRDIDRQFSAVCDMVHHEIQERMKEVRR